jgi:S1-C subfamily serine protease
MIVAATVGFLTAVVLQTGLKMSGRPPQRTEVAGQAPPSRSAGGEGASGSPAAQAEPAASAAREEQGASPDGGLAPEELRNIEIFRRASASVVYITSIALRRDFFSMDVFQIPQGTGSGFVWDRDGHIVTNFHVVEAGDKFSVTLADQSDWEAEVVGLAPDKDLAVLKVKAPRSALQALPLGSSSSLSVGQTVLAVGNPFGLDHSLTVGVVSALGRELRSPNGRTIRDVIQTDAAINPGNSGGPLLDSHGRLVGINSAIYSPSGAFAGIGFAVPVDTVKRLVPQLISHGRPIQPGIGVSLLPDYWAERLKSDGVVVYEVMQGTPADDAGLEGMRTSRSGRVILGDQIVAIDGKRIRSSDDLMHAFEQAGVGGSITLTVQRDGKERSVTVKLIAVS